MWKNRALTPKRIKRSDPFSEWERTSSPKISLPAVLEIEGLTGGVERCQSVQEIHIQIGPFQSGKGGRQHINGHHLIVTLPKDPVPVLLTVPHLTDVEGVKAAAIKKGAAGHHELDRGLPILKGCNVFQSGKARRLIIVTKAGDRTNMGLHLGGHLLLVGHGDRLLKEQLNKEGASHGGGFPV